MILSLRLRAASFLLRLSVLLSGWAAEIACEACPPGWRWDTAAGGDDEAETVWQNVGTSR